jgi:hypothetical protein
MRCLLSQVTHLGLTVLLLVVTGAARQAPSDASSASSALRKRVFVDGKPIPANRVMVKDGVDYVEVSVLAEALGASVQSKDSGVVVRSARKAEDCDEAVVAGQRFSEQFRTDVAGVADEIESLRAVVLRHEKVELGPRFDAIDRKLSLATVSVQTDADMAVYYALAYANNSLAITYFKQARGVPVEEAQKNQLDSMMCAMESKFALMKGVLLPGGSCSVFQRIQAQSAPK